MKNAISKPGALALGLLLLIGTCMVSCKKDMDDAPSLRDQIAGAWTITSFAIDGLEMIDLGLESSTL